MDAPEIKTEGNHQEEKSDITGTKDIGAWLDKGSFDGVFTSQQISSAIEKLVEPGEKVEQLLMRSEYRDVTHANAFDRLLRKAEHFQDKELESLLHNHAASNVAIGGKRIDILKQTIIGQMSHQQTGFKKGFKDLFGVKTDNDK